MHAYPVYPMSPMRLLQIQQCCKALSSKIPNGGIGRDKTMARRNVGGDKTNCLHSFSWPGSAWTLDPLASLSRLASLSLSLVPASGSPSRQLTGGIAPCADAGGDWDGESCDRSGQMNDDSVFTNNLYGSNCMSESELRGGLIAGQAVLLSSLSSLAHLQMEELTVRLLAVLFHQGAQEGQRGDIDESEEETGYPGDGLEDEVSHDESSEEEGSDFQSVSVDLQSRSDFIHPNKNGPPTLGPSISGMNHPVVAYLASEGQRRQPVTKHNVDSDDDFNGLEIDHGDLDGCPQSVAVQEDFISTPFQRSDSAEAEGMAETSPGASANINNPLNQSKFEFQSHNQCTNHAGGPLPENDTPSSLSHKRETLVSSEPAGKTVISVTMTVLRAACLLPSLTRLDVKNCRISSLEFVHACRGLPRLRQLSLCGAVCLSHPGIESLKGLLSLSSLHLEGVRE